MDVQTNSRNTPPITLDEFKKLVNQDSKKSFPKDYEAGFKDYLRSEEAVTLIEKNYALAFEDFLAGELTEKEFKIGEVSATANCLDLMW